MFPLSCNKCYTVVGAVREPPLRGLSRFYANPVLQAREDLHGGHGQVVEAAREDADGQHSGGGEPVGRESKAHPAFCIISSLDAERYHLPPIQGYKYRFERNGGSLNKANPPPSSRDRALPDCSAA